MKPEPPGMIILPFMMFLYLKRNEINNVHNFQ